MRLLRPLRPLVTDSRLMNLRRSRLRATFAYEETALPMAMHFLAIFKRPLRMRYMVAVIEGRRFDEMWEAG